MSITTSSFAQKTMVYCKMEVTVSAYGNLKNRYTRKNNSIYIVLGNDSTSLLNKNVALTNELKKVETYTNSIDAMNYMSQLGWDLVHIISPESLVYICIYRKELDN